MAVLLVIEWIYGFSGSCGWTTNLNAELLTICYALRTAWQGGHLSVILESDSKSALEMINEGVSPFHPHAPLINHIRSLINRDWNVILQHTLHEGS